MADEESQYQDNVLYLKTDDGWQPLKITAANLKIDEASEITSNLGDIKGGSLELSIDNTEAPYHGTSGTYISDEGIAIKSPAVTNKTDDLTDDTSKIAILKDGKLTFGEQVLSDTLSDNINTTLTSNGTIRYNSSDSTTGNPTLLVSSTDDITLQANNYTNWQSSDNSRCQYRRQGNIVTIKADVKSDGSTYYSLGSIDSSLITSSLMFAVPSWEINSTVAKVQLSTSGAVNLIASSNGKTYRFQITYML